jgi:hypothetical protein
MDRRSFMLGSTWGLVAAPAYAQYFEPGHVKEARMSLSYYCGRAAPIDRLTRSASCLGVSRRSQGRTRLTISKR